MATGRLVMTTLKKIWQQDEVAALYELPLMDLLYQAQSVHRQNFNPNKVQISTLLSIKTGACPENCGYCSQSGHFKTGLEKESLLSIEKVLENAKAAKANGASRFCMGAGWRTPPAKDLPKVVEMVKQVKALGLETCVTLGMLDQVQTTALKDSGLDYYNHNLDTSPEYYEKVITTRCYQDRLDTLKHVRAAGIKTCCGGIIGMGESRQDRIGLLLQLANLPEHPQSVPINRLVPIAGTPLENAAPIDDLEFIRSIAVARIMMPYSMVRLSAGRETMNESMQTLCFFAGANSIFYGGKLLTTANPEIAQDRDLFARLGLTAMEYQEA